MYANLVHVSLVVLSEDLMASLGDASLEAGGNRPHHLPDHLQILVHLHPDINDCLSELLSGLWSTPLHSVLQYGPDLVKTL